MKKMVVLYFCIVMVTVWLDTQMVTDVLVHMIYLEQQYISHGRVIAPSKVIVDL